ncbi:hypothetical protein HZA86_01650 [Candidatus Uhrbacteria bacterium]|nr:hypothetical protein [Candidatus Uhrbacteria bacterium]
MVSTVAGLTPALLNELEPGGIQFHCIDTEAAAREMFNDPREAQLVVNSQFRSLEFQIPAAARLLETGHLPTRPWEAEIPPMPRCAWNIDRFGNVKTSTHVDGLRAELPKRIAITITTAGYRKELELSCYPRLRNVPDDGRPAVVVGSSRYGFRCFLELVVQGGRAADELVVGIGDEVIFHHDFH